MIGATRRQTWRRQDGQRAAAVYRYYQCQARQNQGRCGYHTWRSPDLESRVGEELARQLQSAASHPECGAAAPRRPGIYEPRRRAASSKPKATWSE